MKYLLTQNSRINFTAHAPLHSFKGWAARGLEGRMEIDFEACLLEQTRITLATRWFDTGDIHKNRAMQDFFHLAEHPQAGFVMTECREFNRLEENRFRITVLGILDFAGIRRQMVITSLLTRTGDLISMDLRFKWSFTAFGLKPPRLLFLTVRDIVDIQAHLEFRKQEPASKKAPAAEEQEEIS